ncbi:carbohydrate-binding domain-containing protein [Flavobacterium silvaticum]|uniref:Carbohydrate-binding domain-containing protein n=1 Tax=Flavobacterium silvaticum TaxID=1852020 RepID=A0A972FIW5_9FLAO|nr:carbohydrate-binding domain-containing protein [Flavobacterium silvaticum]NMH26583.1 carbohydrate-binding domain-containing protein [Flavobacterium silvaticum]
MKKTSLIALLSLLANVSFGQQKIQVHNSGNVLFAKELTSVDSIKLDNTYAKFKLSDVTATLDLQKTLVDSLTFTTSAVSLDKIYIIYNGSDNATIINPYADAGVTITANAGTVAVTATSGIDNLEYNILGSTTNGSLTMATDKDVNLVLNNVTLTNPSGAAFNISGGKTMNILLTPGTSNTLTDGTASTKNGTITTDGPIVISNSGALTVNGIKKHGINTSSTISIAEGVTTIASATSDGLHSEGYSMTGGTLNITSLADGIDAGNGAVQITSGTINVISTTADVKGIKTGTNTLTIDGGSITVTVSGAQSKGISSKGNILVNGGTISITVSGATVLTAEDSGFDPSYATGFKSDAQIIVTAGTITVGCTSAADGGKGFSADGEINISGGNFTVTTAGNGGSYTNTEGVADTFSTSGFTSDANINISGGTFNFTNTGIEGKAISSDTDVAISGNTEITITNSGNAGKGIKADGNVTFDGGTTTMNLSGTAVLTASGSGFDSSYPSGVKADGTITVNSGTITVTGTSTAKGTKGLSADTDIIVNNGTISITTAGNGAVYTNEAGTTDSYSSAAFSADGNLTINGGNVTTTSSGTGGKGLKADGTITIGTSESSPTLNITTTGARFLVSGTDYSHPKTLVAAGAVTINNGNNTFSSTDDGVHSDTSVTVNGGTNTISAISATQGVGEGVEAPIITFAGGTSNITASNDGINATYGTVTGGTESNDGSHLYITGGIVIVAGNDAIDSNGNITISGGTTVVNGPTNGPEEGLDFNGTFLMNGGLLISAGSNSMMTPNFGNASTQVGFFIKSNTQLAATSLLHIRKSDGTEMVTFKPKNGAYYFHFSRPELAQSTEYQIYFGGTYTGGNYVGGTTTWGLYTGGTYATGTLKKTFTSSGTSKVNTVTF